MAAAEQLITANLNIWSSAIKAKSAAGRGKSNKLELYGIKKLRELILELAVRGLLVPQDPIDEPASELLKKIAAEKSRLVKEGKIRKQKALPAIEEDEKSFALPDGWDWTKLGNVAEFVNGYAFKSSDFSDEGIGIIKIGDIQEARVSIESMSRVDPSVVEGLDNDLQVSAGDLLIAMSGATTGKLGFNRTQETFYLNQRVGKICPYHLSVKYLYLPLTTKIAENLAKSLGSAIPNLSTAQIKNIVIALPPIAEQHRIVAKVNELMALCDQLEQQQETSITAHQTLVQTLLNAMTTACERDGFAAAWARTADHFDTLFTTERSIDQLKQIILQLAVMGKLVPQDPNDEPASELLKKVATAKAKLIEAKIIRKTKRPSLPAEPPEQELPENWVWTNLYEIGEIAPRNIADDDVEASFVPMQLISEDYGIPVEHEVTCWKEIKSGFTHFKEEDVVLAKITPCFQNGKSAVMRGLSNGFGAGTTELHVFRAIESYVDPEFVLLYLKSPGFILVGIPKMTGTAGQKRITRDYFAGNHFPLPPIAEQHRIVAKVNELMALCDTLRLHIGIAKATQLQLAEAITEQALRF